MYTIIRLLAARLVPKQIGQVLYSNFRLDYIHLSAFDTQELAAKIVSDLEPKVKR